MEHIYPRISYVLIMAGCIAIRGSYLSLQKVRDEIVVP